MKAEPDTTTILTGAMALSSPDAGRQSMRLLIRTYQNPELSDPPRPPSGSGNPADLPKTVAPMPFRPSPREPLAAHRTTAATQSP